MSGPVAGLGANTRPTETMDVDADAASIQSAKGAPPPSTTRSLRKQSSKAVSKAGGTIKAKGKERPATIPLDSSTASLANASAASDADTYNALSMTPAAPGENAGASRQRLTENEGVMARTVLNLRRSEVTNARLNDDRLRGLELMIKDLRAATDAPPSRSLALEDDPTFRNLYETMAATRSTLDRVIGAIDSLPTVTSVGEMIGSAIRDIAAAPSTTVRGPEASGGEESRRSAEAYGERRAPQAASFNASESTTGRVASFNTSAPNAHAGPSMSANRDDREAPFTPNKRPRPMGREFWDVLVSSVTDRGDPRELARQICDLVGHISQGSIVNAIRLREDQGVLSIRFREYTAAYTLVQTIQTNAPAEMQGMTAKMVTVNNGGNTRNSTQGGGAGW
ncbi:hypothetical protein PLICRDRAFT_411296 [Plicaturopsis crispa FD-325 SS-3]|nr:hypothetical protein PLICRDRAFT_411296 [Plicaturopsis crispa FD-325 SS-3]